MRKKLISRLSFVACFILLTVMSFHWVGEWLDHREVAMEAKNQLSLLSEVRKQLDLSLKHEEDFPAVIEGEDGPIKVHYTFDHELTEYIKKQLRRYRSDYSVVTVIDNNTGEILSAVGYQRQGDRFNLQMPYSSTHPPASLIKIVTTAGLLSKSEVDPGTVFNFRGRGTTLYRYQLEDKKDRWTRRMNLATAFAMSNNVIFGKAAINYLEYNDLFQTATSFGFNRPLLKEISMGKSLFPLPHGRYNMAELASGFNSQTLISPIHAAVLASVVANDGVLRYPSIVNQLVEADDESILLDYRAEKERVLDPHSVKAMRAMMEMTVDRGTARSSFRRMNKRIRDTLLIGGKTGSITGGVPYGKRDWFTAFAAPKKDITDKGISISVMNVNVKKWYVKSSFLAKEIIEHYYKTREKNRHLKVAER